MSKYFLKLENITKIYERRLIFENINLSLTSGEVYGISGPNGSGKSTLSKIIAGIISPTSGKLIHEFNQKIITPEELHNYIGFVSPYLVLYDEFSAVENLHLFSKIRGKKYSKERVEYLLNEFGILERKDDLVKAYSSGMKQRLKFVFALQHEPELLLFDEPTSNLDHEGKETVYNLIREELTESLVIIASNEESDLQLCHEKILIDNYKREINK